MFFPDREAAVAQGWDVTWQGTLVSPRYSGILHGNDAEGRRRGFCSAGRAPPATSSRCTAAPTTAQCPLGHDLPARSDARSGRGRLHGHRPVHQRELHGELPADCLEYVSSVRRYEIADARNTQLTLAPHLDEVVRSSLSAVPATGAAGTRRATAGTGGAGRNGRRGGDRRRGGARAARRAQAARGGAGGAAGMGGGAAATGSDCPQLVNDCFDPIDGSTPRISSASSLEGEPRCLDPCTKNEDCRDGRVCLTAVHETSRQLPAGSDGRTDGIVLHQRRLHAQPVASCT